MKTPDVEREIGRILRERLRVDVPDSRADLLDSGLVDSLGFVDLVATIEGRFDIVVSLMDVDLDEFRTVESIARFVMTARMRAAPVSAAPPRAATMSAAPRAEADVGIRAEAR